LLLELTTLKRPFDFFLVQFFTSSFQPGKPLLLGPFHKLAAGVNAILELSLEIKPSRIRHRLRLTASTASANSNFSNVIVFHSHQFLSGLRVRLTADLIAQQLHRVRQREAL
jgi:hypothetical protein